MNLELMFPAAEGHFSAGQLEHTHTQVCAPSERLWLLSLPFWVSCEQMLTQNPDELYCQNTGFFPRLIRVNNANAPISIVQSAFPK